MIVNHAYENRKSLIVTSNFDIKTLTQRIGMRSTDRLQEMCSIRVINCPSWRSAGARTTA